MAALRQEHRQRSQQWWHLPSPPTSLPGVLRRRTMPSSSVQTSRLEICHWMPCVFSNRTLHRVSGRRIAQLTSGRSPPGSSSPLASPLPYTVK